MVYGVIKKDLNDEEYRFDHSITREVVLEGLGDFAPKIHSKAAQMYELTGTNPSLTAMHYDKAGRPDLALGFYVEAAKVASKNLSFAESITYLKRGIELSDRLETVTHESRLSLFLQLGHSQFADAKFVDAYNLASTILNEFGNNKPHNLKQLEAETKLLLGKCCRYIGTNEAGSQGIANLKSACQIFEVLGELQKLGDTFSVLSTVLDHFAFRDEAILYFGKAQKTMSLSDDRMGLAALARKSGMIFDSRRAIDFISSASRTFRSVGATIEVARCQNNLGAEEFYIGDFQSAKENLTESIEIYRNINSYEVDIPLNNLGLVYIQTKDYSDARSALTEAFDRTSEDFNRMCAGMNLATLDLLEQGAQSAINSLGNLSLLVKNSGEPLIQDYFGFNLASYLLSDGKAQEALEWLEKYALNEWKGDSELSVAKRLRMKASILRELGRTDESKKIVAKSEEIFRTTRPQKWFYLLNYYPCDIHILD
jgi:tetratricopeptide (TPR) repeat protein